MVLLGVLFAVLAPAHAMDVAVKEGDQILLRGQNAQVNYTVGTGSTLKISELAPLGWIIERRGNVLAIDGPEPDSRPAVAAALRAAPPRVTVDIQGPSMPIEIHLRDGGVHLNKGAHEARVNLQQGRVNATSRTGGLRVNGRKIDLVVTDSTGRVDVDVYAGTTTLKNHQGDAKVDLFSGQFVSDQGKGTLAFATSTATGKAQTFNGTIQLDLGKGSFTATALSGRVEGKTAEGNVSLSLLPDADVNLHSQSGRVQIQLPPSSGAQLNLVTSGDLLIPSEVKVNRGPAEKSARGKLKGDGHSQLTVRSVDGAVIVK